MENTTSQESSVEKRFNLHYQEQKCVFTYFELKIDEWHKQSLTIILTQLLENMNNNIQQNFMFLQYYIIILIKIGYVPNLSLNFVSLHSLLTFFFQNTNLFAFFIVDLQVIFKTTYKNSANSQQKPHKRKIICQIIGRANAKERQYTFKSQKTQNNTI